MATIYYTTIKGEKMTQEIANKIFDFISTKRYIRSFDYSPNYLSLITQGLPEGFDELLIENKFTDEEVLIKSQSELVYEQMQEEYFEKLPSLKKYDAILCAAAGKNIEEVEITLSSEDLIKENLYIIEDYFKSLWGKYNFDIISNKIIFKENKF